MREKWTINKQRVCNRKSYRKHKDRRLETIKKYHLKIKQEVFNHYSPGMIKCKCCGETIIEFLCLDHIGGGGVTKRKIVGNSYRYYAWLIKNNYPSGYRILCHNCNQATSWGRKCPHELTEEK
jgi:hypothetical protein